MVSSMTLAALRATAACTGKLSEVKTLRSAASSCCLHGAALVDALAVEAQGERAPGEGGAVSSGPRR